MHKLLNSEFAMQMYSLYPEKELWDLTDFPLLHWWVGVCFPDS
jgi:hypothetical protein